MGLLQTNTDHLAWALHGFSAVELKCTRTSSLNQWYHLVGTSNTDATSHKVYLDGKYENSSSTVLTPGAMNTIDRTTIGRIQYSGGNAYFNGRVADVRVYDRVLTDEEIHTIWDPGTRWDLYYPLGRKAYFAWIIPNFLSNAPRRWKVPVS
jgi:hypothetical protein